jgi:hypothetical protein
MLRGLFSGTFEIIKLSASERLCCLLVQMHVHHTYTHAQIIKNTCVDHAPQKCTAQVCAHLHACTYIQIYSCITHAHMHVTCGDMCIHSNVCTHIWHTSMYLHMCTYTNRNDTHTPGMYTNVCACVWCVCAHCKCVQTHLSHLHSHVNNLCVCLLLYKYNTRK